MFLAIATLVQVSSLPLISGTNSAATSMQTIITLNEQ